MNRAELDDIIYQIFGIRQIPQVVDKQIRKYRCSGIEYKAIARTIVYYAQKIKKLPTEIELRQYGIHSIMAYIDEAEKYFKALEQQQQSQPKELHLKTIYYTPSKWKKVSHQNDLDKL